jgi:hypothetical protein
MILQPFTAENACALITALRQFDDYRLAQVELHSIGFRGTERPLLVVLSALVNPKRMLDLFYLPKAGAAFT